MVVQGDNQQHPLRAQRLVVALAGLMLGQHPLLLPLEPLTRSLLVQGASHLQTTVFRSLAAILGFRRNQLSLRKAALAQTALLPVDLI